MATVLDVGVISYFSPVFTFLLVLAISYALLAKTKMLGDNVKINFTIAMAIGFIVLFSGGATKLVNFITPWFVVLFILIVLLFVILTFMGIENKEIYSKLGGTTGMIIIFLLVLVIAVANVFGDMFTPYASEDELQQMTPQERTRVDTLRSMVSPRLLSAVFILIVAAVAIHQISQVIKD